jgi:GNAT superfamily N-acetyltransferase
VKATPNWTSPVALPYGTVRVVEYDPSRREHVEGFRDLNLAWITRHFAVEEADRRALDDPDGEILRPGGAIFLAEDERGAVVGACALVRHPGAPLELAKMAVAPEAQGRGVGHALGAAAIARARALGEPRLELLSNTVLEPAIRLYRRLGFVEVPLGGVEYRRANIRMVLELAPPPPPLREPPARQ